jgi:hypothetical protein
LTQLNKINTLIKIKMATLKKIETVVKHRVTKEPELQATKLPTSYVFWLTLRSKFLDKLAENNTVILDQWKEFEDEELTKIEQEDGKWE